MGVLERIKQLVSGHKEGKLFGLQLNDDVVSFYLPKQNFDRISEQAELTQLQYAMLKMLAEQGQAEPLPNGFDVPIEVVCALDDVSRETLKLPPRYQGTINANIKGSTRSDSFSVQLKVSSPSGSLTQNFVIDGPFIKFGEQALFLLGRHELSVFIAQAKFKQEGASQGAKLLYVHAIQQAGAKSNECRYELGHFDQIQITVPDKVTVSVAQQADGSLLLTPSMGQNASPDDMNRVMGQVLADNAGSIRVGNEIVLLDEERLDATLEVLSNRVVSPKDAQDFLRHPAKYLDASLVDLDLGFSARMHGATGYVQAYFGDTDESGVNWFGYSEKGQTIELFTASDRFLKDPETLAEVVAKVESTIETGATQFEHAGKQFDVSNKVEAKATLDKLKQRANDEGYSDSDDLSPTIEPAADEQVQLVVDVDLNDDAVSVASDSLETKLEHVLHPGELDWSNFIRSPFPHQAFAVKWGLGLTVKAIESQNSLAGALLADDMGLGKTFSALATTHFYYQYCAHIERIKKPTLIVAPLSLLTNWKDEVGKTFKDSPFTDVVILQSAAQLNDYRAGSVETIKVSALDSQAEPKYSLKVGKNFGTGRLDMPGRLVITTYQTMRDYQFSMCLVDWGMVIFDEAQNIKNPNALATRAAKGLKADFKMVTTGTPVENSLKDFWCLMDTACPGLLGSYQEFRELYVSPITTAAGDEKDTVRAEYGQKLRDAVGAMMLRRTKEDNLEGLPAKNLFAGLKDSSWQYLAELESIMSGKQLEVYDDLLSQQVSDSDTHALGTIQQLRNCSLHPELVGQSSLSHTTALDDSVKLASLMTVLDQIKQRDEKCIIFVVNKRLQSYLSVMLGKQHGLGLIDVINGDTKAVAKSASTETRASIIKKFEDQPGFNLIIMSPVAAGVGLTVVGANNVVHLERHWNPAKEAQATDRVYRIGQKKNVNVYVPVALHPEFESFDANLHRLLSNKLLLKDAVVTPEEVVPQPAGISTISPEEIVTPELVSKLSWEQFEALAVLLLAKELGSTQYHLTSRGNDFGADGVVVAGGVMHLIQAKHTQGNYSGYKAIQEVAGAEKIYQGLVSNTNSVALHFISNCRGISANCKAVAQKTVVNVIAAAKFDELLKKHVISLAEVLKMEQSTRLSAK